MERIARREASEARRSGSPNKISLYVFFLYGGTPEGRLRSLYKLPQQQPLISIISREGATPSSTAIFFFG
jgi:hypothetical protein